MLVFATTPSSHTIPHADCIEESQARRPPGLPLTALMVEYSLSGHNSAVCERVMCYKGRQRYGILPPSRGDERALR